MSSNFTRPPEIIKRVFKKFGWNEDLNLAFKVWEKVVGTNVARYARAREIGRKRLVVEVSNNCLWQELNLERNKLVKKINEYFGYPLVHSIKFELKSSMRDK
jgi:hypothetical protein